MLPFLLRADHRAQRWRRSLPQGLAVGTVLALAGLLVSSPAQVAAQTRAQYQRVLELNEAYLQHKAAAHWEQAAETCEQMLAVVRAARMPKAVELAAFDQLALARLNLGQYPEAGKLYEEVIEGCRTTRGLDPKLMYAGLIGKGRVHRYLDEQEDAATYFRRAIDHAQKNGLTSEANQGIADLALSLIALGRSPEAIEALLKALPNLKRAANPQRTQDSDNSNYANALHALANAYDEMGRFDLGEPYHRAALDAIVANVGWRHSFTAIAADSLANSYQLQGRAAEAEQMYRAIGAIYESTIGREHLRYANLLNNLARLLEVKAGRHEEAEAMAREALRIKRKLYGNDHPATAISMVNLGNILSTYQDRSAEAEPMIREALAIYQKSYGPNDLETAQCLQVLSTCRMKQGDYQEALELIDRVLAVKQRKPAAPMVTAKFYATKATVLQMLERRAEAAEALDQALKLLELQRAYAAGVERERAGLFEQWTAFYCGAISYRAALGEVDAMFAISESMKARAFLDELQTQRADLLAGLPEARRQELIQQESRLRRELSAAQAAFDALPDVGPNPTEPESDREQKAAAAVFAARDALYQHLSDVKASSTTYRELLTNQAETATLAALQAVMGDGELVLSYVVGEHDSYVIVVRRDAASFAEIVLDEPTAGLFEVEPGPLTRDKLTSALLRDDGVLPALSSPQSDSEKLNAGLAALWTTLVPPAERESLTTGKVKRLTILPSGALSLLPFEALVVTNRADPEYLLDVGPPVIYAPSASVLLNLIRRAGQPSAATAPVLALGNPAYPQTTSEPADVVGRLMATSGKPNPTRAALSPLPFSDWEAKWVKQHFEEAGMATTLLTRAEATEAAVRNSVAGRKIVHLACHGRADQSYSNFFGELALAPGRQGDPADDGLLSMSEIYGLKLQGCELAILSACQTNYGPEQMGEGVWALSRAFLIAGARRVVASNWVVDDEAGATLVSYFVAYLARTDSADYDYAAALLKAKQNVRKDTRWAHPFYWSSLVLVGPK